MSTDFEAAFQNEPVNFLLSNALRHLTQDQQRQLCNALQERLPIPASIEDEAKALYPDEENADMMRNIGIAVQRNAHITCAHQYMGTIEKLRAENSKLRKALEEIQLIVATESREELNITGLLSIATEDLK